MSKLMIKGQQASGTYGNASDIKINEISGMTASNAQEALVALNTSFTNLDTSLNQTKTSVNSLLSKFDISGSKKIKTGGGSTSESLGISSTYGGYYITLLIGSTSEGVMLAFGYYGSSAVGHIFIKSYANKSETTSGWVLIK